MNKWSERELEEQGGGGERETAGSERSREEREGDGRE